MPENILWVRFGMSKSQLGSFRDHNPFILSRDGLIDVSHPLMEVIPSNIILQGNAHFKTLGVLQISRLPNYR